MDKDELEQKLVVLESLRRAEQTLIEKLEQDLKAENNQRQKYYDEVVQHKQSLKAADERERAWQQKVYAFEKDIATLRERLEKEVSASQKRQTVATAQQDKIKVCF